MISRACGNPEAHWFISVKLFELRIMLISLSICFNICCGLWVLKTPFIETIFSSIHSIYLGRNKKNNFQIHTLEASVNGTQLQSNIHNIFL